MQNDNKGLPVRNEMVKMEKCDIDEYAKIYIGLSFKNWKKKNSLFYVLLQLKDKRYILSGKKIPL